MDKKEMRQEMITKLTKLAAIDKKAIEEKLFHNLTHSTYWQNAKTIGITISRGFEWDTKPIIEEGWKQGKVMAVPKCNPDERQLTFYRLHDFDELESVYHHLLEPRPFEQNKLDQDQIDLVVVPGVVFDERGFRIGFGGGYYDRFLSGFRGKSLSILSENQLVPRIPIESHDIAVNHLVTETVMLK